MTACRRLSFRPMTGKERPRCSGKRLAMQPQVPTMPPAPEFDGRWELIMWSDDFTTGNDRMDDDHRRLLSLFNEFSMAVNAGKGGTIVRGVLDELVDYTRYHFAREELLMMEAHYPDYLHHKKMHDIFARQVEDVCNHLSVGADMCAFLLSFLAKWLSGHILGADRKLGRYLGRQGVAGH